MISMVVFRYLYMLIGLFLIINTNYANISSKLILPEKDLLLKISRIALTKRVPSVDLDDLACKSIIYSWSNDDFDSNIDEDFLVSFIVKSSIKGNGPVSVNILTVNIETDGEIRKDSIFTEFCVFSDDSLQEQVSSTGESVFKGGSFYPIALKGLLAKPDVVVVNKCAIEAIKKYLPKVDFADVDMINISYSDEYDNYRKDSSALFTLSLLVKSTFVKKEKESSIDYFYDEICMHMTTDGVVSSRSISMFSGYSIIYK